VSKPQELILMYDRPGNHDGGGITVVFGDGHAEFHGRDAAKWMIEELAAGHNPPHRQQAR
jgi:prepilin-type processing-associated H-X9-DG protein